MAKTAATTKPKYKLLEGHTLIPAFELGGIQYYEFPDTNMAPSSRMFSALDFYNEFNMRCTREFLVATMKAMRENLNGKGGKIDFVEVAKLVLQVEERLEFIHEPETAYKYASVVFIDENEDPYNYDSKYNQEKIARWKKEAPESFFLSMPVKRLFPLLGLSERDLKTYLTTLKKVDRRHLENLFTILSANPQTKGLSIFQELLKPEA